MTLVAVQSYPSALNQSITSTHHQLLPTDLLLGLSHSSPPTYDTSDSDMLPLFVQVMLTSLALALGEG